MNRFESSAYHVVRLAACLFLLGGLALCESPSFVMAGLKLLPDPWNKEANVRKLEDYARRAAAGGADLIVTPEGYLEGYVGNPNILKNRTGKTLDWKKYLEVAEPDDGPSLKRTAALAREINESIVFATIEPSKFTDSSDIWKRRRPEIYQEILRQDNRSQ